MTQPSESNKNVGNIWSQYSDVTSAEIKNPVAKVVVSLGKILSYFTIIIPLGVFIADKLSGRVSKIAIKNTKPSEVTKEILNVKDSQHQSPPITGRVTTPPARGISKISSALSNPLPNPILEQQAQPVERGDKPQIQELPHELRPYSNFEEFVCYGDDADATKDTNKTDTIYCRDLKGNSFSVSFSDKAQFGHIAALLFCKNKYGYKLPIRLIPANQGAVESSVGVKEIAALKYVNHRMNILG